MVTQKTIKSFTTGGPQMMAHILLVTDEVDIQVVPVIGWILEKSDDTDDIIRPGIYDDEWNVVQDVDTVLENRNNAVLIGLYPEGIEPPDKAVEAAEIDLLTSLRDQWDAIEKAEEPWRSKVRSRIEKQGKALRDMIEVAS